MECIECIDNKLKALLLILFRVRYNPSGAWHVMQRLGGAARSHRTKRWRDAAGKKCAERRATLAFIDESGFGSGFCLVRPLKRSWALRGHTSIVRTGIDHHPRIRLHTRRYRWSLTGHEVLAFLRELLCAIRGPIVLVWDNATIHRRALMRRNLEEHSRRR